MPEKLFIEVNLYWGQNILLKVQEGCLLKVRCFLNTSHDNIQTGQVADMGEISDFQGVNHELPTPSSFSKPAVGFQGSACIASLLVSARGLRRA